MLHPPSLPTVGKLLIQFRFEQHSVLNREARALQLLPAIGAATSLTPHISTFFNRLLVPLVKNLGLHRPNTKENKNLLITFLKSALKNTKLHNTAFEKAILQNIDSNNFNVALSTLSSNQQQLPADRYWPKGQMPTNPNEPPRSNLDL